jgi:hypothetical protein
MIKVTLKTDAIVYAQNNSPVFLASGDTVYLGNIEQYSNLVYAWAWIPSQSLSLNLSWSVSA